MVLGLHFPQLLDADAVGLGVGAVAQLELRLELLAEVAATAFGEQRVLGVQLHARLVVRTRRAITIEPHVAGGDALHRARLVEQDLGAGKARIDLHTQRLGLLAEPLHHVAQAHDVVAVVHQAVGQQAVGGLAGAGLGEEQHACPR